MPKHLTTSDSSSFVIASNVGEADGVAPLGPDAKVPEAFLPDFSSAAVESVNSKTGDVLLTAADVGAVAANAVGNPNGVAPLDATGRVPVSKLPLAAVQSVNGYVGPSVTLAASDVGALTQSAADGRYTLQSTQGQANGVATLDSSAKVPGDQIPALPASQINSGTLDPARIPDLSALYVTVAQKGAVNGIATLGADGKVPASQLPATTAPVTSVNSKTGEVTLTASDVGALSTTGGTLTGTVTSTGASASSVIWAGSVSGDTFDRMRISADGSIAAGPGSATRDTTMARTATGEWTMNGKLVLGGDPTTALGAATKQYVDNNYVSVSSRLDNDAGPADQGFLAWSGNPAYASDTGQPSSGGIRLCKIFLRRAATISNIWVCVTTAGATLTSGQNLLGLYTSAGARVAVTADQATAWTTTGNKSAALTASYSAAAGTYYVAILSVGTTIPQFSAMSAPTVSPVNANLTVSTGRFLSGPSGQTSLPANITMSSNTFNYTAYWVAVS
jgi:hypothetical protein